MAKLLVLDIDVPMLVYTMVSEDLKEVQSTLAFWKDPNNFLGKGEKTSSISTLRDKIILMNQNKLPYLMAKEFQLRHILN
jgi:hypothetical protein